MSTEDDDPEDGGDRFEEMVEIYSCSTELEANRVIDELLTEFAAVVHNRKSSALPAVGEMGGYFIAVPADEAVEARAVLSRAHADGELDVATGSILGA